MVIAHQFEGNNVELTGTQADGLWKSAGYNHKMGFGPGAQHDIFEDPYEYTSPVPPTQEPIIVVGDSPQGVLEEHGTCSTCHAPHSDELDIEDN